MRGNGDQRRGDARARGGRRGEVQRRPMRGQLQQRRGQLLRQRMIQRMRSQRGDDRRPRGRRSVTR